MDAIMMSLFNSKERGVADWEDVFARAGKGRFAVRVSRVKANPATGVVVGEWQGE
jgi:hypothetical protein